MHARRIFPRDTHSTSLGQAPQLGQLLQELAPLISLIFLNHLLDARETFLSIGRVDQHRSISVVPNGMAGVCRTAQTLATVGGTIVLRAGIGV